jgi:hypothetical protein
LSLDKGRQSAIRKFQQVGQGPGQEKELVLESVPEPVQELEPETVQVLHRQPVYH